MTEVHPDGDSLLTPSEVAAMFRVDPKTITRWAKSGRLESFRTLGGHRRYRLSDVRSAISKATREAEEKAAHRDGRIF